MLNISAADSVVLYLCWVYATVIEIQGRVKLLSAAGSAAVLFNGIKESWRLARKILSQFKLLWFLNVFFDKTLLAILLLEIAKKNFAAGSAEQLNFIVPGKNLRQKINVKMTI